MDVTSSEIADKSQSRTCSFVFYVLVDYCSVYLYFSILSVNT